MELTRPGPGDDEVIMIDAPHLKARRTAANLLKEGLFPGHIGRTKGGLNSKLHVICDCHGRPLNFIPAVFILDR